MASDASDSCSDDNSWESDPGEQMDWEIEVEDDPYGSIYELCRNYEKISEYELVKKLTRIFELVPGALREPNENGWTPLHVAIDDRRSFDFCKVLIDNNPDLVKTPRNGNFLPIHDAIGVDADNNELIKFLIEVYPESVNIPDVHGWYPVQRYIFVKDCRLDVLQLLLKCDQKVLYTPNHQSDLLLHYAVERQHDSGEIALEVFNAYPQAIYSENIIGFTPLDMARHRHARILDFLEHQSRLVTQARQTTAPDENGWLPIHRTLLSRNASLGAIKLMVAANPTSISVADNKGRIPLHIAIQTVGLPIINEGRMPLQPASQTVDLRIVKFLVERNKASLSISDFKGNNALHHACAEGNCNLVNFILAQSTQGVSMHNMDGKLPLELLLYEVSSVFYDESGIQLKRPVRHGKNYRETKEYIEAVYHLLRVYPDALKDLAE